MSGRLDCVWCDRECPRCRYPITGGFVHDEQRQQPDSNVVVCSLRRLRGSAPNGHEAHRLRIIAGGAR